MLYLLGYSGQGQLRIFGKSNEKYHVRGGNDQIPARLADALQGQITTGVGAGRDQAQLRTAATGSRSSRQRHEHRHGRPRRARPAVLDPARRRLLESRLLAGQGHGDPGARDGDELEAPRPVRPAGSGTRSAMQRRDLRRHRLPEHLGGHPGAAGKSRDPRRLHRRQHRRELRQRHADGTRRPVPATRSSRCCPGSPRSWNGRATVDFWTGYQWTKGSYSYWKVGQYTKFAGAERAAGGRLPLRRRAHLDRLPGLPERRRRDRANGPPDEILAALK